MTSLDTQTGFHALLGRLFDCRRLTETLAAPLSAEDQTVQSMPDTSPTKWHRAHTTWFFETFVLEPHLGGYERFNPHFNYLFNSYYEAVGARHPRPERGMVTRPGVADIGAYRQHVDRALAELGGRVDTGGLDSEVDAPTLASLIELGINHEQQHQELLLMDIKHVLAANRYAPAYLDRSHRPLDAPGPAGWLSFDGGIVDIGHEAAGAPQSPNDEAGFRFDNEEPRHQVLVEPFSLADRLVTCGEWLEFIDDGGYHEAGLWLSDGWYTSNGQGWEAPLYWQREDDGQWLIHTLTGLRPVDENEPVCHVSFYEADAFATWSVARLATELEWEHAARPVFDGIQVDPDADTTPELEGLLDQRAPERSRLHPGPAGPSDGATPRQLIGHCWEWTGSAYRPYPRYAVPEGAIGEYNGKFMINTMVLRGGCALTPADHIRATYRNFFHPHTRWHLSGVRLARD